MAKIYETRADMRRDEIKNELSNVGDTFVKSVISLFIGYLLWSDARKSLATPQATRVLDNIGLWVGGLLGIGSALRMGHANWLKRPALERELKALGPEQVKILEEGPLEITPEGQFRVGNGHSHNPVITFSDREKPHHHKGEHGHAANITKEREAAEQHHEQGHTI